MGIIVTLNCVQLPHTCAIKGVIRAPTRAIALQIPMAKALISVGNTWAQKHSNQMLLVAKAFEYRGVDLPQECKQKLLGILQR